MNKFKDTRYYNRIKTSILLLRLGILIISYAGCIALMSFITGATIAGAIGKELSWYEKVEGIIAIVYVSIVCMYFIRLRTLKILYKLEIKWVKLSL